MTAKVRTFGNLRKEWLAEQKQWNAWQAALLKDEPLEEITATVTKAQGAIDTALGLLRQQLKPLLAMQEQVGYSADQDQHAYRRGGGSDLSLTGWRLG